MAEATAAPVSLIALVAQLVGAVIMQQAQIAELQTEVGELRAAGTSTTLVDAIGDTTALTSLHASLVEALPPVPAPETGETQATDQGGAPQQS